VKVKILPESSSPDNVIVVVDGDSKKVAEFIEWLDDAEIKYVTYFDYFTGIHFHAGGEDTRFWAYIEDEDHQQRCLIKLRWQGAGGNV
jgi:acylphosphatase